MNRFQACSIMRGSTISQFVPVDTSNHRVCYAHQIDGFSQILWFVFIQRRRIFHSTHCTESACPCTFFTGDHECGRPSPPTIVYIRALCLLTYGIQLMFLNISANIIERDLSISCWQVSPEPRWQSLPRFFPTFNRREWRGSIGHW